MSIHTTPGVYNEEVPQGFHTIPGVETSITAFVGRARRGPRDKPIAINAYSDFELIFGGLQNEYPMSFAVSDYFLNGGNKALIVRVVDSPSNDDVTEGSNSLIIGDEEVGTGLYALKKADMFNILCIPPGGENNDVSKRVITAAANYCEERLAILILDSPQAWTTKQDARDDMNTPSTSLGTDSSNAALFFPRIRKPNPLRNGKIETFAACGAVAGVMARTDAAQGIWKGFAGVNAVLNGVTGLSVTLTDAENEELYTLGCNCLRVIPLVGPVVWGERTLRGNNTLSSEWKYISVCRLALFIKESLYRGTQWVVFEPNNEPLWNQIRLYVRVFMHDLFRQGAFQGAVPIEAFFVKCDGETTTQSDIEHGILNFWVGFAPIKPAEFVILRIQQMTGQSQ